MNNTDQKKSLFLCCVLQEKIFMLFVFKKMWPSCPHKIPCVCLPIAGSRRTKLVVRTTTYCKIKFLVVLCCKKIIFIEYVDIIRNFVCAHAVF